MKKLFIFAMMASLMLACTEKNIPESGEDIQGGSTDPKEISCDPTLIEFDVSQDYVQTIMLKASSEWSATTNVDWISIEPLNGQGDAFVKLSMIGGKIAEGKVIFSTGKASAQVIVKCIDKYEGSFSVSSTKKVYFSKGNLQYQASTQTWRFAEYQYDIIGDDNKNISSSYSGWIDLFGWGTSGYNGVYPYLYYSGTDDIAGTNYDWGVYNSISNGGNQSGLWRTLTESEWRHVFFKRKNASTLYGLATVNGVHGYILLPDAWVTPYGLYWNGEWSSNWDRNKYSASDWQKMEQAGAVFIPAVGIRIGKEVEGVEKVGYYWTSSLKMSKEVYCVHVQKNSSSFIIDYLDYSKNNYGCAVRLVKDVE